MREFIHHPHVFSLARPALSACVFLVIIGSFLLSGCVGSRGTVDGEPIRAPPVFPSATVPGTTVRGSPALWILSPPFDGGVLSGNVTITVQVDNFVLEREGTPPVAGSGHLVYYRDVVPPVEPGELALSPAGTFAISYSRHHVWTGGLPGTHTFAVQLVTHDNTPLDPPALDAIDVTAVSPGDIAVP